MYGVIYGLGKLRGKASPENVGVLDDVIADVKKTVASLRSRRAEAPLTITDNGKDCVVARDRTGMLRRGHFGMDERVNAGGGVLALVSTPGGSATVRVVIPCSPVGL